MGTYLKSLEIENIACFGEKQRLDFCDAEGNVKQWNILLGENGTGKSTLLRGILEMLSTQLDTKITTGKFIKEIQYQNKKGSRLGIELVDYEDNVESPFSTDSTNGESIFVAARVVENRFEVEPDSKMFSNRFSSHRRSVLSAYSESRKMNSYEQSMLFQPTAFGSFLNPDYKLPNLIDAYSTLKLASASNRASMDFDKMIDTLTNALPDIEKIIIEYEEMEVLKRTPSIVTKYGSVSPESLSSGYTSTISWLVDFILQMLNVHSMGIYSKDPLSGPAVCIIDEIDLHMHPSWQRKLFEYLEKTFPRTQFIVTAHSPLIVQSAVDSKVFLLKAKPGKKGEPMQVKVTEETSEIHKYRVGQILTSDLFGLDSEYSQEVDEVLKKMDQINGNLTPEMAQQMEADLARVLTSRDPTWLRWRSIMEKKGILK